jgi:ABC-type multidrug transport system ATPase subunit
VHFGVVTAPALALRTITRRFRAGVPGCSAEVVALDSVSLTLMPGESLGIVGEAGAGKSTLLLCATRLLSVDRGEVVGDGARYVPPHGVEHPYLSVRASLEYAAVERELASDRGAPTADALLERTQLTEYSKLRIGELTAGLRARVAVAHALIDEPRLLCIDEPSIALSPAQRLRYGALLATLRRDGLSVLIAARKRWSVAGLTQRAVTLERGRVVESALRERTLELDVGAPRLAVTALADRVPSVVRSGRALRVVLDDELSAEEVMSACRSLGISVYGSRVIIGRAGRVAEEDY